MSDNLTNNELDRADRLLHEFVIKTEEFFSKTAMTSNLHQLTHIAKSVYNWGPLWAHSTYSFETGNYQLLKAINSAKRVNLQMVNLGSINLMNTVNSLKKHLYPSLSDDIKMFCGNLKNRNTKKCFKILRSSILRKRNITWGK